MHCFRYLQLLFSFHHHLLTEIVAIGTMIVDKCHRQIYIAHTEYSVVFFHLVSRTSYWSRSLSYGKKVRGYLLQLTVNHVFTGLHGRKITLQFCLLNETYKIIPLSLTTIYTIKKCYFKEIINI